MSPPGTWNTSFLNEEPQKFYDIEFQNQRQNIESLNIERYALSLPVVN